MKLLSIKGTLSLMKLKFKRPSGFMAECIFVFNSHNSGNFHSIEKNDISKSKLGSRLSKTKGISEIEQKALFCCCSNAGPFFGTPGS